MKRTIKQAATYPESQPSHCPSEPARKRLHTKYKVQEHFSCNPSHASPNQPTNQRKLATPVISPTNQPTNKPANRRIQESTNPAMNQPTETRVPFQGLPASRRTICTPCPENWLFSSLVSRRITPQRESPPILGHVECFFFRTGSSSWMRQVTIVGIFGASD